MPKNLYTFELKQFDSLHESCDIREDLLRGLIPYCIPA